MEVLIQLVDPNDREALLFLLISVIERSDLGALHRQLLNVHLPTVFCLFVCLFLVKFYLGQMVYGGGFLLACGDLGRMFDH